jgi:uncharacterized protein (TIGR02246 family)
MSRISPAVDAAQLPAAFVRAFNSGDAHAVERLYEPGAVFVAQPGELLAGDKRLRATAEFLRLGVPIAITLRHAYVTGDLALLIGDFVIDGTGPDGAPVHLSGTATDVARRGADGYWRYVISNPPGVEDEP